MARQSLHRSVLLFKTTMSASNSRSYDGVYDYARFAGWNIKSVNVRSIAREERPGFRKVDVKCVKSLLGFWNPDGCIVMGDAPVAMRDPGRFGRVPVVFLDALPDQSGKGAHCVSCDNAMVARTAARELLSLGFNSYGYVSYVRRLAWCEQRQVAFEEIVRDNGKAFGLFRMPKISDPGQVHRKFAEWIGGMTKPCGIFAANDMIADAVTAHCLMQGLAVPDDVAVIGVDNDEVLCENSPVSISSVALDFRSAGVTAGRMLQKMMENGVESVGNEVFPISGIVRRQSTRLMPKRDPRVIRALEFIRLHAVDGISVGDVVRCMGCSRRNADLLFGALLGKTILEEIHDVRIRHVKDSLRFADKNMKIVASCCGYNSVADMRRVFKKHEGCTVSEYVSRVLDDTKLFRKSKRRNEMKSAVVSLVLLLSACAHAVTWHVDRENGDDSAAANDPTGATPFATIQKAVERAADGETVLVGPGVYDEGNGDPPGNGGWGASRVGWANKKIILKSTHGPDVTHITGVRSKDTELGIGSGAVRCLAFKSDNGAGAGSVVEGFTLRDGATVNDGGVGYKAWGGAFYSNSHELYIVGCVISNCVAYESGVCANGTLYRCLVDGNSVRSGQYLVRSSNGARTRLYSSVFTRNSTEKDGIMLYNVDAVGCTFIGNRFGSCTYNATGSAYNCVFLGTGALHASFGYENCVSSGRPVMSPLLGDWRALSTGSAAGMGDADHVSRMSLPEGYEPADFYGNAIQGAATLAAGASAFPVASAGGCVSSAVSSGMKIDGCPVFMNAALNYVYAETYPTQYHFTVDSQAGKRVCRYNFSKITDLVDKTAVRFPDMDDGLWVMPPPSGHELVHESVTMSSSLIWVEPDADAENADGSEENPYRTIKAAIAAAGANAVICCREGTYAEGEASDGAVLNRVLFPSDVTMRLIGVGGAEKTVILGASDGSAGSEYGLGPDAVRCVRGRGLQQVQGFTLTGGRTTAAEYGGAVRSGGTDLFVSDCIITNNAAAEGAAVYGARLQRCVIAGNSATAHFVLSTAPMSSCAVFSNKVQSAGSYGYVGYNSPAYNTTFLLPETDSPFLTWGTGPMYNCVVSHASSVPSSIKVSGCVFWNVKTLSPSGDHLEADPYFADESAGDVRPFGASPVFSAPELPTAANYGKEYWYWVSTDLDGIPFTGLNGGRPFAGAYGTPSQKHAVIVKSPLGGLSVAEGVLTMEEGSTVTISAERGSRPCAGVSVGGEISYFMDGSVTVPYSSSSGGMVVEAVYTNVWYAAVDGNDSAAGSFPDAALTLQGALSNPDIEPGDRVLALPGEYSEGEMAQGDGFDVKARAVVPAGVTLESVEGNALTTIKGKAASAPDDPTTTGWDVRGMGADAVRCVYLNSGSRVKGFTLTDGFTRVRKGGTVVDHEGADTTGGGVYAGSGYTYPAWVEDCVITNCAAYRGGGVKRANVLRCVLVDNYSLYFGSAASDCACYETLTKNNECPNGAMNAGISYWSRVEGCTVLDALGDGASSEAVVANTLVKGYFMAGTVPSGNIRNCAVNKDMRLAPSVDAFATAPGTLLVESSALEVDRDGRPVIGGNVAVDAGDPLLSSYASETDLSGMQRIYNARPDIGALEADWRPRYADDIGARGITVAAASATVTESPEGRVRLNPGAVLDAVWTLPSATGRRLRSVTVSVSGEGELAVSYNGIVIGTVLAADGTASVPFKDDLAVNSLTFAYSGSGYAEILGVENEAGMKVIIR